MCAMPWKKAGLTDLLVFPGCCRDSGGKTRLEHTDHSGLLTVRCRAELFGPTSRVLADSPIQLFPWSR
jgi:hypothetical protein